MQVGDGETEQSWRTLCAWLKERGLHGVDLVVSDDHGGLVSAIAIQFQGVSWQRCQTHFSRNVLTAHEDRAPQAVRTLENGFDDATAVF